MATVHGAEWRLGQLLVVMGALLGAVLGVSLALIVEHAGTSSAVCGTWTRARGGTGGQPPERQALSLPGGQCPGSGEGQRPSANQRAESAGRADQRDGKAHKNGEGRRDKPGRGKTNPGKSK